MGRCSPFRRCLSWVLRLLACAAWALPAQASATPAHKVAPLALADLTGIALVSGGDSFTCVLTAGGGVKCWGLNDNGQLGDTSTTDRVAAVNVSGLTSGISAVATGGSHACALTTGGGVKCWGANSFGQLGDGSTTRRLSAVNVSGLASGVTAITAGESHACALVSSGVKCWGSNSSGQLGNNSLTDSLVPVDVAGLASGVLSISGGAAHTCAVMFDGTAKCWGANFNGQLGDGSTSIRLSPVAVAGLSSGVAAISAGRFHTCALTAGGGAKCWGWNGWGQLGDGTVDTRLVPIDVSGLATGVAAISAGGFHTCSQLVDGTVRCWGNNDLGALGDGTRTDRLIPVDVVGLPGAAVSIGTGRTHTCSVISGGGVRCWGANFNGQLGNDVPPIRTVPVGVSGLGSGATQVGAGWLHSCALTSAGGVKCWGGNRYGQLGDGSFVDAPAPIDVSGLGSGVIGITVGTEHSCALTTGGGVKCWGLNGFGQLGDGSRTNRQTPVDVSGLTSGVAAISAGGYHTCALTVGGGVKCWGLNGSGALGDGSATDRTSPVDVTGLGSGVIAIAAGGEHTCALTVAGGIQCWGFNNLGQLGDDSTTSRATPADVPSLTTGVSAITTGQLHTCALMAAGGIKCWGSNSRGQLGDGASAPQALTPVDVVGPATGELAVDAGWQHTCALNAAGGAECWGYNNRGQLGDDSTTNRQTPVAVLGLASGVAMIAGGLEHTCAIDSVGGVLCWGDNLLGQLGNGTLSYSLVPATVLQASLPQFTLSVQRAGSGSGSVTSSPAGISCGASCAADLDQGTLVTLSASATAGSTFSGWSGACSGTGSCQVTMEGARSVTATFLINYSLSVTKVGTGTGTVTASPAGINCGATCSAAYPDGTSVSLTATPGANMAFTGWGGDCSGTGACVVSMVAARSVTAEFQPVYELSVAIETARSQLVEAGGNHTCAITVLGGLNCWGRNNEGQVGDNSLTGRLVPVGVVGLSGGVAAVSLGYEHSCALTTSGGVKCWGRNDSGQLGISQTSGRLVPTDVIGLGSGVVALAAGGFHTCALSAGGGVKCWGYNGFGQLGDGTFTDRRQAVSVAGLASGVAAISAGRWHTCALMAGGSVKCWGYNFNGQLGNGGAANSAVPVDVSGLGSVAAIESGALHNCVLTAPGGVKCWGYNDQGQLGDGSTLDQRVPTDVLALTDSVASLTAGTNYTCALMQAGSVRCWGWNNFGQLGIGSVQTQPFPVDVPGLVGEVTALSAGASHACGLNSAGDLRCWGYNDYGQVGDGTVGQARALPALVSSSWPSAGAVSSSPVGISCGTDCSEIYLGGTVVTLTVTPGSGYTFAGWSGACSGTGACQVTMSAARTVRALFVPTASVQLRSLAVAKLGGGAGLVESDLPGIVCGAACAGNFPSGASVTLVAVPAQGSVFTGWGGACSGTGSCTVTVSAATTVFATFEGTVPSNLVLSSVGLSGSPVIASRGVLTVGPGVVIVPGSLVTLIAGRNVVFVPPFQVPLGTRFEILIDPSLGP